MTITPLCAARKYDLELQHFDIEGSSHMIKRFAICVLTRLILFHYCVLGSSTGCEAGNGPQLLDHAHRVGVEDALDGKCLMVAMCG